MACIDTARQLRAADGALIAYRVREPAAREGAAAPPLLLIHGLASNGTRFEEFVEQTRLAKRHALIRVDLRGHGAAVTRRRVGTSLWCDDLAAIVEAEGRGPAIVVGHSLGAQVALHFAARQPPPNLGAQQPPQIFAAGQPRRVAGLVLIDPVFRAALHGRWPMIAAASPLFAAGAALVRALNAVGLHRRTLVPLDLRALDRAARAALATPAAEQAFIAQYSSMWADLRHVPLAVYLQDLVEMFRPAPAPRTLNVPVLALLSTGATFADAQAMRSALAGPRVAIETIECHHWPLTERPREVQAAIEGWIDTRTVDAA